MYNHSSKGFHPPWLLPRYVSGSATLNTQVFRASATLVNHGNTSNYLPWNHSMVSPREIYRICETTSWSRSPIAEHLNDETT